MRDAAVTVTDHPGRNRYEIALNDHVAFLEYRRRKDHVVLVHTEVPVALRNRGLGGMLAKHALDDARRAGLNVIVKCPFVTTWLQRHKAYDDIVIARVTSEGKVKRQRPAKPR
jgi:predicted GNAT family acetyltransferase